jgi:transmembrane sensor
MSPSDPKQPFEYESDAEERAAAEFVRGENRFDKYSVRDSEDPSLGAAREKIERVWKGVGQNSNRPEFLVLREQALSRARRANQRRWSLPWTNSQKSWGIAASIVGISIAAGLALQISPYGYRPGVYQTGIGEQRTIELNDGSHIALDSNTRIRATLTADARTIELTRGQAQFNVVHDPTRPFKVMVDGHTIVDVGTVFTVEYIDQTVQVALIEGKVAVLTPEANSKDAADMPSMPASKLAATAPSAHAIELSAGEELRFAQNGTATVTTKADIHAATAWREGKMIFHSEPLAQAVRRLNRYSKVQLQIDGAELASMSVSGIFDAGDSRAFADAVEAYLPVTADYSQIDVIKLKMK